MLRFAVIQNGAIILYPHQYGVLVGEFLFFAGGQREIPFQFTLRIDGVDAAIKVVAFGGVVTPDKFSGELLSHLYRCRSFTVVLEGDFAVDCDFAIVVSGDMFHAPHGFT